MDRWKSHVERSKEDEEALLDRFRDPGDPLKVLIVTSKLLTGFDAPILQTMYLDRPIRDHNLLQAICRTNRTYPDKTHGLIVDYLGIFDDVAQALDFDEKEVQQVITNLDKLKDALPEGDAQACLDCFPGVDRTVAGYEGLLAAQECLPDNDDPRRFRGGLFLPCASLGGARARPGSRSVPPGLHLAHPGLRVCPTSERPGQAALARARGEDSRTHPRERARRGRPRRPRHARHGRRRPRGAHSALPSQRRRPRSLRSSSSSASRSTPGTSGSLSLASGWRSCASDTNRALLLSLEYLKELADLAREAVQAEREVVPEQEQDLGKAALTELFEGTRNADTPIIVERVVNDIDDIVEKVRFPEWQHTDEGERTVKQALRRTLLKYKLHRDQELFEKAYGYIKQYY